MRTVLTVLIVAAYAGSIYPQLVISACCGDAQRCKNYTNIDELIAVSCCGHEPINQFTHICCQNTVRQRWHRDVYHERCCGNETISIKQTCCGNVVHNVVNGDCCGSQSFDRNDKTTLCCDGMLTRTFVTGSICCGREAYDGGVSEICCGGRVFQKSHFDSCCQADDGTFTAFSSATHSCCNGALPRNGDQACCYLRHNDRLVATPYNTTNQCCKYPYTSILPMRGASCVT